MSMETMQEKARALFKYIKEVCSLNRQEILDVNRQEGTIILRSLDDSPCVVLSSRDTVDGEEAYTNDVLLSFRKPEFTACPSPDESLVQWLAPGWEDYHNTAVSLEKMELQPEENPNTEASQEQSAEETNDTKALYEYFTDNSARVALFESWAEKRIVWVEHEKQTERLRSVFNDLFEMYNRCRQSPDTLEIVIGNGLLTDKQKKEIHHPLFLKRANLSLDSVSNTLTLSDTDETAQVYSSIFTSMEDISSDILRPLEKKVEEENIHPWDHHKGADFLKSVAHQLHVKSRYLDEGEEDVVLTDERILVRWEPYIILRRRADGTDKALQSILDDLDEGAEIPTSLLGILGSSAQGGCKNNEERPDEQDTQSTWTESVPLPLEDEDILLPKPANREQMDIVRKIEHAPAVLVQGPPGTGKTHTIANLLGHFLAKGKTVLVTSHTSKALTVLKEKVPKEIQALCVAVFGDNRADMEESISSIIEHTSLHGYVEQKTQAEKYRAERHQTLLELQKARKLAYSIRHKEFEPIVYCGDSLSPSGAAKYISQHEEMMALIPGEIAQDAAFPLAQEELEWLYASNGLLSREEEEEFTTGLPDAEGLMTAQQFSDGLELLERLNLQLQAINAHGRVNLAWKAARHAVIDQLTDQVYACAGDSAAETTLRDTLSVYEESIPGWAVFAMSDGAEEALPRKRWEQLLALIDEAYTKAQSVLEKQLTRPIKMIASSPEALAAPYEELCKDAEKHGCVKKTLFMSKEKKNALDAVTIAGNMPQTLDDLRSILAFFELSSIRERLAQLWDSLIAAHGSRRFAELGEEPERICYQQRKIIEFWLNWVTRGRKELCEQAEHAGIGSSLLQPISSFVAFTDEKAAFMLDYIREQLVPAMNLLHLVNELHCFACNQENTMEVLQQYKGSSICEDLTRAIESDAVDQYTMAIDALIRISKSSEIQERRKELLDKLSLSAPDWANAIRNRSGIHGSASAPDNLLTAWKVRQLSMIVDEITSTSLSEAEKRVTDYVDQFRTETAKLAASLAWCNLQKRIDGHPEMRQALNGWKQTMAKIGKGTGKRAPALRTEARKLMVECQKAVPAWIMPVSDVMSSIDPAKTKFDIIIIDEASQSNITAAAILYMGKKVIVVGDNEQVSPLSVGLDESKIQYLMDTYIKDKIPNAHLLDMKTSLYDIAAQAQGYEPLMLKEHFRCVPDIIGYSNWLSYRENIKPLREAGSSPFKTALVPFRVNGIRKGRSKTNEEEADAIVALIKACMEHSEYADKTFGVISMLGDDQAKLITRKLAEHIPLAEYERHQILCGNASNFQGDERDIIFLSLVDSNESDGPLAMASGDGQGANGSSMKQRYNVAVSRAKDQLWIVHSLDYTADLKPRDMRRKLLEYAANPRAYAKQVEAIDEAADSPFEAEVAKALIGKGYHIVQQWEVGAYRIDMVAVCGKKKMAIECDGERWHSGEEKIREDMERQAILERLGWRFIRIRGSEYYRRPDEAISRVIDELNAAGISPEANFTETDAVVEDALTNHIKVRAMQLMSAKDQSEKLATFSIGETEAPQENTGENAPACAKPEPTVSQDAVGSVKEPAPVPIAQSQRTVRTEMQTERAKPPKQSSPLSTSEDLLAAFQDAGFTCIDNRKTSGLLWVLFNKEKVEVFHELERQYMFKASLERRGASATKGKPAWLILMKH